MIPGLPAAVIEPRHTLADSHGCDIGYLRLSLTPACPIRWTYCRPSTIKDMPSDQRMSAATIESFVRVLPVSLHELA